MEDEEVFARGLGKWQTRRAYVNERNCARLYDAQIIDERCIGRTIRAYGDHVCRTGGLVK